MKTEPLSACERCGEQNPEEIHSCTPPNDPSVSIDSGGGEMERLLEEIRNFIRFLSHRNEVLSREKAAIIEFVDKRVVENHKECLVDQFINGRFWEAKEMQGFLSKLS